MTGGLALRLPPPGWTTRFAPAPTGYLHLGHVANALWVWGLARAFGGRVLLRVEDHDRIRCRPELEAALLEDLDWLGLVADSAPIRQGDRGALYAAALARLGGEPGRVYVCDCTRKSILERTGGGEIDDTGAVGDELRYPGTCRDRGLADGASPNRRIRLEREEVRFDDLRLGEQGQTPAAQCGDLAARDRDGNWTYQFAVTVDDFEQEIDLVIRGADLLASTGRQIQLSRLLGRERPPLFLHHSLILKPDGAKLSKSNGDTGIRELRAAGWSPGRTLGAAALAVGLTAEPRPLRQSDLADLVGSAVSRER